MKDLYSILGVSKESSQDEIKKAFLLKAKAYHPDVNKDNPGAEEKFKEINNAYETLKDTNKRNLYDISNVHQNNTNNFSYGFSTSSHFHETNEVHDIFSTFFKQQQYHRSHSISNQNVNITYNITLEDSFNGKETQLIYNYQMKERTVSIQIPPGIEHGAKIRYPKLGDDTHITLPPGDLFVTISIISHPDFTRIDKTTLFTRKTINYLDAILGCELDVPTIEGSVIKLSVPPNIGNKTLLKAGGKGMKMSNGLRGDMLVELTLVPPNLTPKQIKDLHGIRANLG